MMIISKYLVPRGYAGITLYPLMILKSEDLKNDRVFINHEGIHLRQQLELLIIFFYLIYGVEFLFRLIQYKNWNSAYLNISFEREAYAKEKDLDYLQLRPFWSFIKYF